MATTATDRPFRLTGQIGINIPGVDPLYADYASGGAGRGSMPYGVYPIMPYTPSTPKYGLQGFALNNPGGIMPDPKYPGGRSDIMLHLDPRGRTLDELVSNGCLSVEASDWPALRDQIVNLQKQGYSLVANLTPDGNVTIMRASDVPAGTPIASSTGSFATATNQTRQSVSTQQAALAKAGFNPGAIDGIAGPQTKSAIMAFQQANGLRVDGIIGPQTSAALSNPALNAINAVAPNGSSPTAYAPTPAALPSFRTGSSLLAGINPNAYSPTPAGPKTGTYGLSPNTGLPIKLGTPIGRTASDGKTSTTTFGLGPDGRTAIPVSHTSPLLIDPLKEMGNDTIIGGIARAEKDKALAAAGSKVAELGSNIGNAFGGLFGGGAPSVPKPPLLTPGANAAPGVAPMPAKPPAPVAKPPIPMSYAGQDRLVSPPVSPLDGYLAGDYGYTPQPGDAVATERMPPMGNVNIPPSPPLPQIAPRLAGTAQGGRFGYMQLPDGSIVNNLGRITAGPSKPMGSGALYDAMQAAMRQGTFSGRGGGSIGTTLFTADPNWKSPRGA